MSSKDSVSRTLLVAFLLCVICSVIVSASVVGLRPQQLANKELDRKRNILEAAGLIKDGKDLDISTVFSERVRARPIQLATGDYDPDVNAETFDFKAALKNPKFSVSIPATKDIARIRERTNVAVVYEIYSGERLDAFVLPIHGKGLWSTLWGFLALKGDGDTIIGLSFYDHAETPGLGGEVDNPAWKALWVGKTIYDQQGQYQLKLIKGKVDPSKADIAQHEVDGLSGATLTTNGVDALLRYWLSDEGYGHYLAKFRSKGGEHG